MGELAELANVLLTTATLRPLHEEPELVMVRR